MALFLFGAQMGRAASNRVVTFDLPAGDAAETLKLFIAQSNEQVIYPPEEVREVVTQPVRGRFTPGDALGQMLTGTGLSVLLDHRTGALAVTRHAPARGRMTLSGGPQPHAVEAFLESPKKTNPSNSMITKNRRPSVVKRAFGAVATFLFGAATVVAQPAPADAVATTEAKAGVGIVRGEIFNDRTGARLERAVIAVEGTSITVLSERGGGFAVSVPTGAHTLVVSYTGLNTVRLPVTVAAGQTVERQVGLTADVYTFDPYTVTGQREGNAKAIQLQRQADNVKTVVSTDAFGNPAVNPGELLQRLSGVSVAFQGGEVREIFLRGFTSDYLNLQIDGNSVGTSDGISLAGAAGRQVNISQVATNNLESVELIKSPLPDQSANAIAGFINLRTKRAFDRGGRSISASAGTRWTHFENKDMRVEDKPGLDVFSLNYSDVYSLFGKKKNLGVMFSASYRNSPLLLDEGGWWDLGFAYSTYANPTATNGLTSPARRVFGTGSLFYPDTRNINIGLNFDYKISDNTFVYVKNTFNDVNNTSTNSGFARFLIYNLDANTPFAPGSNSTVSEVLPTSSTTALLISNLQRRHTRSYTVSAGGEHKMPESNSMLSADFGYTNTVAGYPIVSQVVGIMTGAGFKLDASAGPDEFHPAYTQTGGPSVFDPSSWSIAGGMWNNFSQSLRIPIENWSQRIDYRKDFRTALPFYIKVGLKINEEDRGYRNRPSYDVYTGPSGIANYLAPASKTGDGAYAFPLLQLTHSGLPGDAFANPANWSTTNRDMIFYNAWYGAGLLDLKLKEKVSAAYVMSSVQLPKVRLVGGVRVERTETAASGYVYDANIVSTYGSVPLSELPDLARRSLGDWRTNKGEYTKVHPGLHMIIEPGANWVIRASWNTSITRAPINLLAPWVNNVDHFNKRVSLSNPKLKPFTSDNFDIRVEKYFEPIGSFEVGVYLKEIKDYIRSTSTVIPAGQDNGFNGEFPLYTLSTSFNAGRARYRGFEINYSKQFSTLPGFWRGFGVNANYTYTSAKGDFGSSTLTTRLAGIRPRFGNVGISYLGHGLDARLLLNWQGRMLAGNSGTTEVYNRAQKLLDLKTQYRIDKRYSVYFEVINILNETVSSTVVGPLSLPVYAQKQGTLFTAGVDVKF